MIKFAQHNEKNFEKNINLIKQSASINQDNLFFTDEYQKFIRAKNSDLSMYYEGKLVHSKFNPTKEASQRVAAIAHTIQDTVVVIGMGLGYIIEALSANRSTTKILVVENDPSFFSLILSHVDLESINGINQCSFLVMPTKEKLRDTLVSLRANYPISLLSTPTIYSDKTDNKLQKSITQIKNTVHSYAKAKKINYTTLKRFKRRWISNILSNISYFSQRMRPLSLLQNIFDEIPCVICSAGPTLDDEIPWLRQNRAKFIIIAVDTALVPLQTHGITPDVCIVADPQYINSYHLLTRATTENIIWVVDLGTHPSSLQLCKGSLFVSTPDDTLCKDITNGTSFNQTLESGGSVTTLAWELARLLGCPIAINLGLDLGFPKMKSHTQLSFFEQNALLHDTKLTPMNNTLLRLIYDAPLCLTNDNAGIPLISDIRMNHFRMWFSRRLQEIKNVEFFAKSSCSSVINGMQVWKARKTFSMKDLSNEIFQIKHYLFNYSSSYKYGDELLASTAKLMETIKDYKKLVLDTQTSSRPISIHDRFLSLTQHPALYLLEFYLQDVTSALLEAKVPSPQDIQNWIDESSALIDTMIAHGESELIQPAPVQ